MYIYLLGVYSERTKFFLKNAAAFKTKRGDVFLKRHSLLGGEREIGR